MRLPFLESPSIVRLTTLRPATEATGTLVDLFVGPAALVLISFFGSRRPRAWTVPALISASAVWGVPRIGVLISHYTPFGGQMGAGYWLMMACVCVVILGAVVVFMSSRTARRGEE